MMEHLSDCKLLPNWLLGSQSGPPSAGWTLQRARFVSHYWGQHIEQFVGGLRLVQDHSCSKPCGG